MASLCIPGCSAAFGEAASQDLGHLSSDHLHTFCMYFSSTALPDPLLQQESWTDIVQISKALKWQNPKQLTLGAILTAPVSPLLWLPNTPEHVHLEEASATLSGRSETKHQGISLHTPSIESLLKGSHTDVSTIKQCF